MILMTMELVGPQKYQEIIHKSKFPDFHKGNQKVKVVTRSDDSQSRIT